MKIVYGEHCLTPKHGCSPEVILVFLSLQPSWGSVNSSPARVYTVVNSKNSASSHCKKKVSSRISKNPRISVMQPGANRIAPEHRLALFCQCSRLTISRLFKD